MGAPTIEIRGEGPLALAHVAAARAAGWRVIERSRTLPCDVIAVVDPTGGSADEIVELLESGRTVIAEPPWCRTLDEADRVVHASISSASAMLHAEHLAYSPAFEGLLRQLGSLGEAHHIEARSLAARPVLGGAASERMLDPVRTLAPGPIGLVLLIAKRVGAGKPVGIRRASHGEADAISTLVVDFESGIDASIVVGWHPGTSPVVDVQVASGTGVVRAELLPRPTLERNGDELHLAAPHIDPPEIEEFGLLGQLHALEEAMRHGAAPITDARFGRSVFALVADAAAS